jgi:hypothetical protein
MSRNERTLSVASSTPRSAPLPHRARGRDQAASAGSAGSVWLSMSLRVWTHIHHHIVTVSPRRLHHHRQHHYFTPAHVPTTLLLCISFNTTLTSSRARAISDPVKCPSIAQARSNGPFHPQEKVSLRVLVARFYHFHRLAIPLPRACGARTDSAPSRGSRPGAAGPERG